MLSFPIAFRIAPTVKPRPHPRREELEIKVHKPLSFHASARATPLEFRKLGEAYLAILGSSLYLAQQEEQDFKTRAETEIMAAGGYGVELTGYRWRRRISEAQRAFYTPIYSDLMNFQRVIKERHGGSLPDWVKDNRNWRALYKEFAR